MTRHAPNAEQNAHSSGAEGPGLLAEALPPARAGRLRAAASARALPA
ncbi:hypothetical protein [Paraburkholderia ferrariae]|nr:hypothetical protein [Paraburkholderia ferrariae]